MTAKKDSKDTTVTFRISLELKKKLEIMAAKDSRSLSNFIVTLLDKAVNTKK